MKLQKLTEADMRGAIPEKIYCYEKSMPHLTELCDTYQIVDRICQVIDDNVRQQGTLLLNGREVPVVGAEYLEQENLSGCMVIITSDYHREAYEKLCKIHSLCEILDMVYYFADRETEYEEAYRECYKDQILEDMILFRSGPHALSYVRGMDFSDNARALFEYMLKAGYNKHYKLVWLVKDPQEFPAYQKLKNVEFLSFEWSVSENREERDRYYHALCMAKFLFFTDAYGFARNCRADQVRVQLWHGCGFKTRVNFVRCEKRYDYTTVISDLYGEIHQDVYGLRPDQMLVTGYAKQDWLFQPLEDDRKKRLNIPKAQKYIYWLPTFRTGGGSLSYLSEEQRLSETGLPILDSKEKMEQLNDFLVQKDMAVIIKLHPFQDRERIGSIQYSHIMLLENETLFEEDIPLNRLMADADALISDYSSVAVDYMLLDRPIAFTLDDVDEYEATRGFIFHPIRDWLPGAEIDSPEDLFDFLKEVADDIDSTGEKRRRLRQKMYKYQDGNSCRRILDALGITADLEP